MADCTNKKECEISHSFLFVCFLLCEVNTLLLSLLASILNRKISEESADCDMHVWLYGKRPPYIH